MKFRFIGDPRNNFDGPDRFEKFDHQFSRTEWTEVIDPLVIAKLMNSSHFEHYETQIQDEPRKRGWPKGKPRKVVTDGEDA